GAIRSESRDLFFGQSFFHRRWKSRLLSSEALIQFSDSKPHQLLQRGTNNAGIVQRIIKFEVRLEHVGPMAHHAEHSGIGTFRVGSLGLLAEIAGQLLVSERL